jgi:MazG family protein
MANIQKLLDIMATLRDPRCGCPWDVQQDFHSIAPYTIEEAYEVADTIDRGDLAALKEELGDLLLQVVFHARMAQELGAFEFADVVAAIADKLVRRHPHVFGEAQVASAAAQRIAWESFKAEERNRSGDGEASLLDGVAHALPSLARAAKLGRRAAGVGFDWPDASGVVAKVREELDEVESARALGRERTQEEIGDLLFAVANLARHADVDPEEALRRANRKFERRFASVESQVRASGRDWESFDAVELDAFWQEAKRGE